MNTRFSSRGFAPEGDVCCSYVLEGTACPAESLTARAECDIDGHGKATSYWVTDQGTEVMATKSCAPFKELRAWKVQAELRGTATGGEDRS